MRRATAPWDPLESIGRLGNAGNVTATLRHSPGRRKVPPPAVASVVLVEVQGVLPPLPGVGTLVRVESRRRRVAAAHTATAGSTHVRAQRQRRRSNAAEELTWPHRYHCSRFPGPGTAVASTGWRTSCSWRPAPRRGSKSRQSPGTWRGGYTCDAHCGPSLQRAKPLATLAPMPALLGAFLPSGENTVGDVRKLCALGP